MNQEALAAALGLTFQQVQKYEKGANRLSASRLAAAAKALGVPVSYFFEGLQTSGAELSIAGTSWREIQQRSETIDLIRNFYAIGDAPVREQFLLMVKAVAQTDPAT
jgi:transcriptional regulator with XRE-family HTH domain